MCDAVLQLLSPCIPQDMLTMLGEQGPNYNNEEFPELNIFPSFSE